MVLNPMSDKDRRITAFTNMFFIEKWELDTIRAGYLSYDCWGKQQGGVQKFTTTPEYLAKYGGLKSYLTLRLMQMGCCPPQLMQHFIATEGLAEAEPDAAAEALKLHKRGSLGGG